MAIQIKETFGTSDIGQTYFIDTNKVRRVDLEYAERGLWSAAKSFFVNVFLPKDFPLSVSSDYLEYQLWDSIQAFCSGISGSLSTQAVLRGIGVGSESATVAGATVTWLLRNGSGMIGGIWFAWWKGSALDTDCKKWRFAADVLNDGALFLQLLGQFCGGAFLPIMCVSSIMLAVVGVAGGATRAAITQHQARANNMADVSAKDGSQETLVNLFALLCSLMLVPIVVDNQPLVWLLFVTMVVLHLFANYMAVKAVRFQTLNAQRYSIVFERFMDSLLSTVNRRDLSIASVNAAERVVLGADLWVPTLLPSRFGCSLQRIVDPRSGGQPLLLYYHYYMQRSYFLHVNSRRKPVLISAILAHDCQTVDLYRGYFHCLLIAYVDRLPALSVNAHSSLYDLQLAIRHYDLDAIHRLSIAFVDAYFQTFFDLLAGHFWNLDVCSLNADQWRFIVNHSQ